VSYPDHPTAPVPRPRDGNQWPPQPPPWRRPPPPPQAMSRSLNAALVVLALAWSIPALALAWVIIGRPW
jgi:hypothetical protein